MKDRDAFALGAAVDNLIKITAGENGCRYSHALTACNMLPVSMGASCQDIFISKIQMPETIETPISIFQTVYASDRVKRKIYLSRRKSQRHNKLSYKLSKEFRKRGEEEEKIGARSYLVASLYTNFCRRPIRQGPHHVCKCTSIGPCFTTNHP